MSAKVQVLALLFSIASITGCTTSCCFVFTDEHENTYHHMIIGFGIIKTPKPKGELGASASKATSLGLSISNQPGFKLGLGYSQDTSVVISDTLDDILLEVSTCNKNDIALEANTVLPTREPRNELN